MSYQRKQAMKISEVFKIIVNKEERDFIKRHGNEVFLHSLNEHENWVIQNLVRKGVYDISKNNKSLIKVKNV